MEWFITLRNIAFLFATLMLIKYFVFLVIAPFYTVKEKIRFERIKRRMSVPYKPLVSIVIPAWNEEIGIKKSILSLVTNTYKKIEIIVINDGSTDRTEEAVKSIKDRRLRYFKKENGGKGTALNLGVNKAKGEIIVTMDADSAFDKQAIENLIKYFRDDSIMAVVGNVKIAGGKGLIAYIQKLEYKFGFYFKRAHAVMGAEYIFGGACSAFRREVFEKLGGFDIDNKTEDIEMSMRMRFNGMKCTFASDVICYTEGASSIMGLANQRLRWKKGRFDTFIKYRRLFMSLDRRHNKFLSWFVLPYALLSELQLLFEPIALTLLLAYSFISGDYLSLAIGSLFIMIIYFVESFWVDGIKPWFWLTFFFTWPLFYFLVWIEYLALIKGFFMILRGDDIKWQRWNRVGVSI